MTVPRKKCLVETVVYILIATLMLLISPWTVQVHRYLNALLLVIAALGFYFFIVYRIAGRNWLDIRAVFHGVWILTIALASLQLTDYQEDWQTKTWICLAGAYAMFQIGANFGVDLGKRKLRRIGEKLSQVGAVRFWLHKERLFWTCVVTTLIGLACFSVNVAIRGYIPCFSDDPNAYVAFYTKFHVFAVAATVVSGLCYYCIRTQNYDWGKKLVLWLCILYSTFLFPTLVVSRGTFVVSALSLTVAVFYLNRKRLWVLVTCLILILAVYLSISVLRGYTDAQLKVFFEPSQITVTVPTETGPMETDATEPTEETPTNPEHTVPTEPGGTDHVVVFQMSPKVAFVYGYLTVSHDNFNEAVQNLSGYSYGARLLSPFNVVLQSDWVEKTLQSSETYLVRNHLNTINLIGDFYYDFHEWGVFILMLLWSFVFGVMQVACDEFGGPVSILVMGNAMTPVALCFFSSWMSNFTLWLFWGTALLIGIALCAEWKPKENNCKNR